jgi:hypothetical protein
MVLHGLVESYSFSQLIPQIGQFHKSVWFKIKMCNFGMIMIADNILIFSDLSAIGWRVFFTCIVTFIINLPFGYLRGGFKKLSFWWFAAIHLPVPLIIVVRKYFGLSLTWELAPFLFGSFFLGQYVGRKLRVVWPLQKK